MTVEAHKKSVVSEPASVAPSPGENRGNPPISTPEDHSVDHPPREESPPTRPFTVRQAAEFLTISSGAVYQLCRDGLLAHYRLGAGRGLIRIEREALEEYLTRCRVEVVDPSESSKGQGRARRDEEKRRREAKLAKLLPAGSYKRLKVNGRHVEGVR